MTLPSRFLRRFLRILRTMLLVIGGILLLVGIIAAGIAFWYYHRPLPEAFVARPLFQGITYTREIRTEPRPLVIHVVKIDLDAPGLGFLVTPGDYVDGYIYKARTTSTFLDEFHVQLAINADSFDPWLGNIWWDFYPHAGDGVNPRGLTFSQGEQVAKPFRRWWHFSTLYISADNQVSFDRPLGAVYNGVSGLKMVVENGQPYRLAEDHDTENLHPRTAVALDQTERTLILMVVDGRQPNYSEGVTLYELAGLLMEYGAYTALNMDGGGSSALVIAADDGRPVVLNSPIHGRVPGWERPIADHLGVFADPLD